MFITVSIIASLFSFILGTVVGERILHKNLIDAMNDGGSPVIRFTVRGNKITEFCSTKEDRKEKEYHDHIEYMDTHPDEYEKKIEGGCIVYTKKAVEVVF